MTDPMEMSQQQGNKYIRGVNTPIALTPAVAIPFSSPFCSSLPPFPTAPSKSINNGRSSFFFNEVWDITPEIFWKSICSYW
jgi:hypothetical protein